MSRLDSAARHSDFAGHAEDRFLALVQAAMFNHDESSSLVTNGLLNDRRLGVDCVAMKHRREVADVGILQSFERAPADIGLAHPDDQADDDGAFHQSLAMLRSGRIMFIDMQRMLVHTEQAEQRVVELSNGAAGPMTKGLARFKVFEVTAV